MTTRERAEAVKAAAQEIDAAIVAKGGTTAGGLRNAAAAIAALPSGGGSEINLPDLDKLYPYTPYTGEWPVWHGEDTEIDIEISDSMIPCRVYLTMRSVIAGGTKVDFGDGSEPVWCNNTAIDGGGYTYELHTYESAGLFTIRIAADDTARPNNPVLAYYLGNSGGWTCSFFYLVPELGGVPRTHDSAQAVRVAEAIRSVRIGRRCNLASSCLSPSDSTADVRFSLSFNLDNPSTSFNGQFLAGGRRCGDGLKIRVPDAVETLNGSSFRSAAVSDLFVHRNLKNFCGASVQGRICNLTYEDGKQSADIKVFHTNGFNDDTGTAYAQARSITFTDIGGRNLNGSIGAANGNNRIRLTIPNGSYSSCFEFSSIQSLSGVEGEPCKNWNSAFGNCGIANLPDELDLSEATNLSSLFSSCRYLTKVPELFGMQSVQNVDYMFQGNRNLRDVPKSLVLPAATTSQRMFEACSSMEIPPKIIRIPMSTTVERMFADCHSLREAPEVFDISSASNAVGMFQNCYALSRLPAVLDLSSVTNAQSMFSGCTLLTDLPSVLDLSSATNTSSMFGDCKFLKKTPAVLDLSSATNTSSMFSSCYSLSEIPNVLNLSSATSTYNMFYGCSSLKRLPAVLDLSSSTSVSGMFTNCSSLLNLPVIIPNKTYGGALTYDFGSCISIQPECLARFDDQGNIIGGFAAFLPVGEGHPSAGKSSDATGSSGARTLKLHTKAKLNFTTDERSAIAAAMTAHGWTLSW